LESYRWDGYVDQFGGPNDKKFMMSRLKKMLLDIYLLPVDRQLKQLEETLVQWQGDTFQVDDITVMGVKITPELL
jgi:serine phosphatase RsbU (regulator of sigma subunit)